MAVKTSKKHRCVLFPPGESRHKEVRYVDIHEDDEIDPELLASWIRQASTLPGWIP